jgi:hypothetical protein
MRLYLAPGIQGRLRVESHKPLLGAEPAACDYTNTKFEERRIRLRLLQVAACFLVESSKGQVLRLILFNSTFVEWDRHDLRACQERGQERHGGAERRRGQRGVGGDNVSSGQCCE